MGRSRSGNSYRSSSVGGGWAAAEVEAAEVVAAIEVAAVGRRAAAVEAATAVDVGQRH